MQNLKVFKKKDYFKIIHVTTKEIEVKSNNTEHYWKIQNRNNAIKVYHKHFISDPYHRQKLKVKDLTDVKRAIISHDLYQMNGRRAIDPVTLEWILQFYM